MKPQLNTNTSDFISRLRDVIDPACGAWLVGGAVRDQLAGRPCHDLDIILNGDVRQVARRAADSLEGKFFPLDEERGMYRILLASEGQTDVVDFSRFQADTLEADLGMRDFTINAMAMRLHEPAEWKDPLNGRQDLKDKILRPCSDHSFRDDPVRTIRAIRMSLALDLHMAPDVPKMMREASPLLTNVSAERKRDELFKILNAFHPSSAIRLMDYSGLLPYLFPDLLAQKGVEQSPPHKLDVWEHTLAAVFHLNELLGLFLQPDTVFTDGGNLMLGLAAGKLGRFREAIQVHYQIDLNPFRSRRSLCLLAALLHDIGKPAARTVGPDGKIHFYRHETLGAKKARDIGQNMALSEMEVNALAIMVANHMKPRIFSEENPLPTRRNVYRFYRSTAEFGVDTCFLSLADFLAKTNLTPDQDEWTRELDRCSVYLEGWFQQRNNWVEPERLLNGSEIMEIFQMKPGKIIGKVLEQIKESQASGDIASRDEALELAKIIIRNSSKKMDE
jgi:putative nucleotidyltransferase with HDIG domain